ncbi:unnamed protein product [Paramecium sonneborni]|uniref:Uncharacterized protein n=1 Tax=Paramecium sonneborni TaxID=65129 RepID=A0A8S1KPV7_9CILI|nr:unnamed protein product [Paramecium sonneborni]
MKVKKYNFFENQISKQYYKLKQIIKKLKIMNQRKYKKMRTKNKLKLRDEVSTEIEQFSKEKIILKRLAENHKIEYLVQNQKQEIWRRSDDINIELINYYEENQRKSPKILGKSLIRICDLEVKNDQKYLKVQLEGDNQLQLFPYSFMKLHVPHQLVQFLLSIYNPYM